MFTRLDILTGINDCIQREDGIAFQRLSLRLLEASGLAVIPHYEHNDLGRDGTVLVNGRQCCFCSSLRADWRKIAADIRRALSTGNPCETIYYCTARAVTQQKIHQYVSRVSEDFGVEFIMLERAWVIAQCLRVENHYLVAQELGIRPSAIELDARLLFESPQFITKDYAPILNCDVLCNNNETLLAWCTAPSSFEPERVYLKRILPSEMSAMVVAEGADPAVIRIGDRRLVSWTKRISQSPYKRTYQVAEYDKDLRVLSEQRICESDSRSYGQHHLFRYREDAYLCYMTHADEERSILHMVSLSSSDEEATELDISAVTFKMLGPDCSSQSKERLLCIVDDNRRLNVYQRCRHGWQSISSITNTDIGERDIHRWDAAIRDNHVLFIFDNTYPKGWSLKTLLLNLSTGEHAGVQEVAYHGKFPSIGVLGREHWIASWVGSPPQPLALQDKRRDSVAEALYFDAITQVQQETERQAETWYRNMGRMDEYVNRFSVVDAWAPLWIGILDRSGRCIDSYGPLGYGGHPQFGTVLDISESHGVLAWRLGEDADACMLMARQFTVA